jgi:hypothetical protein
VTSSLEVDFMGEDFQDQDVQRDGWRILRACYGASQLESMKSLVASLIQSNLESVRQRDGAVYAARNVLELCPQVQDVWRTPLLEEYLQRQLGSDAGLVRALYFDKPPNQTWALPWHKDLLIAVADATRADGYSPPRPRAGVLHTEPPLEVLESMLTLRIHLDPVTAENGPLEVLSGSHLTGKQLAVNGFSPVRVTGMAGDVLVMSPLLVHSSGRSHSECRLHRRILHLEFSGMPRLPGGVRWQTFHAIARASV